MAADILAVQPLYGLSTTTRSGDTTYGFNSNAGDIYNAQLFAFDRCLHDLRHGRHGHARLLRLCGRSGSISIPRNSRTLAANRQCHHRSRNDYRECDRQFQRGRHHREFGHQRPDRPRRCRQAYGRRGQRHFPGHESRPQRRHYHRLHGGRPDRVHGRDARRLHLQPDRQHADLHRRLADAQRAVDGTIIASAAAGGGVQLSCVPTVANSGDFNGDGRDDILLRHDNGTMTNWLGQANGGFFSNRRRCGVWTRHRAGRWPASATLTAMDRTTFS